MKCKYCGMESLTLSAHRTRCVDNPEVWAATRAALDDGTGTIRTAHKYKAMQRQPVSDTTLRKRYGTWAQVADAFGLRWHGKRKRKDEIDLPLSNDEQGWARDNDEPQAEYVLHGYRVRYVEARYRLPTPGVGLRVTHEYIALR